MDDIDKFIELVSHVCRCPGMYTVNGTYGEVAALFTGIQLADPKLPIADDKDKTLNRFVTARLLVPDKYWWAGAIKFVTSDDESAIRKLRELLIEFATLRKTKSLDEIRELAAKARADYVEPEPAQVWRQFLAARYTADKRLIEPLILPHPDADVLWRGNPTPPDVAQQLNSVSGSYIVSIVSGSIDSGKVSMATEIGVVEAHRVDGQWRIDASFFIEKSNAEEV